MSKRQVYECCMHYPTDYSYIEKIYRAPQDKSEFLRRVEDFIRTEYFDDGMDEIKRPTVSGIVDSLNVTCLSYSLNKRYRWRLVEDLPRIVPEISFNDPPSRKCRSNKRRGDYGQTVVVSGSVVTCLLYYFSTAALHRHSPVNFTTSTGDNKAEGNPEISTKEFRDNNQKRKTGQKNHHEEPAESEFPENLGIEYRIGIPPDKTSFFFRKDRHKRGTSPENKTKLLLRKSTPSVGYKFKAEVNEYYQICHDDPWEEQISEEMNYRQDTFSAPIQLDRRVSAYNMEEMFLASQARQRLSSKRKTKKFPMDYEVLDKRAFQLGTCTEDTSVWRDLELQDFSDGISDTSSMNSDDHSWEMVDMSSDVVNVSTV